MSKHEKNRVYVKKGKKWKVSQSIIWNKIDKNTNMA